LLDVTAVAGWLQVTPGTVYRLVRDDRLPGVRVGGQWRFRPEEIDTWLRRRKAGDGLLSGDRPNRRRGDA
jgi:excisionase family DNA binding protein